MSGSATSGHLRLSAPAVILAIGLILGCAGSRSPQAGRTVGPGGEVSVAGVTWRVLQMKRTAHLSRRFAGSSRAQGIFIVLQLSAERESEAGPISVSALSLIDDRGRKFLSRASARDALDEAGLEPLGVEQIAERVPIDGWIAFDVARDARGLRLRVGDASRQSADVALIRLP